MFLTKSPKSGKLHLMSDTTISPKDFAKLVKQANLILSTEEKSKIHTQLDEALSSVKVLSELDTSTLPGTTSASGLTNVLREDEVKPSFPQDIALKNAKNTHAGYFMVPAIFDAQDN
jgi:aspartyl-tRNA(Asn)/glutamyl-tRNA(Gln) amidotransferase subunit C